jgi:hypothetical protein
MQPGSQNDGPLIPVANLPTGAFSVKVLEQTDIDACETNNLVKTDLTKFDGTSRTKSSFEYFIAKSGETVDTLTIAGLDVYAPVAEATCELVRSIEIEDQLVVDTDGQAVWFELRDDADYVTVSYTDFKFDIALDQGAYLSNIVPNFA